MPLQVGICWFNRKIKWHFGAFLVIGLISVLELLRRNFQLSACSDRGSFANPHLGEFFNSLDFSSRYDCGATEVCLLFPILLLFRLKLVVEIDNKQISRRSGSNRDRSDDLSRTFPMHQGVAPIFKWYEYAMDGAPFINHNFITSYFMILVLSCDFTSFFLKLAAGCTALYCNWQINKKGPVIQGW